MQPDAEPERYDITSAPLPEVDIWPLYLEHSISQDKEMVQGWTSDLDSILIFAALFSAVLTTLAVESFSSLQPDPQVEMLRAVLQQIQQGKDDLQNIPSPIPPFTLTRSAVRVNIYWLSSLIISLSTTLLAILAKQW
ncbi:uncharacterized protein BXZ73DRAFT_52777, partial [Epithele typhae]|uniref:uncharacterized protein n=1 Tax=Epithele typhae TaxID=378194 RepID=UPI002007C50C